MGNFKLMLVNSPVVVEPGALDVAGLDGGPIRPALLLHSNPSSASKGLV
jgi:hypothetical protein